MKYVVNIIVEVNGIPPNSPEKAFQAAINAIEEWGEDAVDDYGARCIE